MAESPVEQSVRETAERRKQYEIFKATGKYRLGQIGIDKETNHIIFYPDNQSSQEIYYILISDLQTHDRQIVWIYRLLEKNFFNKKVLEEFFIALGILDLMPEMTP
jgi:hypothetical protein